MDPASLISVALTTGAIQGLLTGRQSDIRARFEKSPQGVRARRNRLIWWEIAGSILAVGTIVTLFGSLILHWSAAPIAVSIGTTLILTIVTTILGSIVYSSALAAFAPQAALDVEKQHEEEQTKLEKETQLPALLRYNRDQMYLYHQIATSQARVAGRNSQAAMAIGFLALVAGSAVAIASDNVTTKLIIGGLAALGGIFSGYIARTFLVAQDQAISQLYKYWEQPLTTSYILAAERVAGAFDDKQTKQKELGKLIDQLLMIAIQREVSPIEPRNGRFQTRASSNRAKNEQRNTREGSQHSAEP